MSPFKPNNLDFQNKSPTLCQAALSQTSQVTYSTVADKCIMWMHLQGGVQGNSRSLHLTTVSSSNLTDQSQATSRRDTCHNLRLNAAMIRPLQDFEKA